MKRLATTATVEYIPKEAYQSKAGSVKTKAIAGRHRDPSHLPGRVSSVKAIALLYILLFPLAGWSTSFAQQHSGFAGYAWGTEFDRMARQFNLTPTHRRGHTVQCSTNLREIGDIGPIECEFEFTDGLFSGVILSAKSSREASMLVDLLSRLYGERHIENPSACQWLTAETHAAYDEGSEGDAYVYIYSRRLQAGGDSFAP